ncbi:autoinducer-binding transcriptional regulator LuxR [Caenispirillum salinarum AK4]|uniref:Autoinducer-binding transcriptional regulator LuxR n=1 Tax=Caenispirillum salinarum AK4 TaxID=1238182 RepID=K9HN46_9PROT|nr:LuxR family transcriptional regulator [Caenispirillum salinarum]EKV31738.1 autoinducer-binding transcriptional regulator LuxR [Caenispirillum salinarum AK4]
MESLDVGSPSLAAAPIRWADRVLSAPDLPALHGTLRELTAEIGLRLPSYALVMLPERRLVEEAALITYPAEWSQHYLQQGYFLDDPTVVTGLRSCQSFAWRDIPPPGSPRARRIMAEAADWGIIDGLTVPLRGGSLAALSVALPDSATPRGRAEILRAAMAPFTILSLLVHERGRVLYRRDIGAGMLTPRERECVRWLAAGKTGIEIAGILHISDLTVTQHLKSAMRKLQCATRAQLAVRAVALGLAEPG